MKLRKNDYIELRKGGVKAIDAKLTELAAEFAKSKMLQMKNELKNPRALSAIRTSVAKLKTIKGEM